MRHHLVDEGSASFTEDERGIALSTRKLVDVAFVAKVVVDVLVPPEGDGDEQGWPLGLGRDGSFDGNGDAELTLRIKPI